MADDIRQPWRRLPGEGSRQYAAFVVYRELGHGRSIRKAAEVFLTQEAAKNAPRQRKQQRRFLVSEIPANYLRNLASRWRHWAAYWQWVGRCRSYDEYLYNLAQVEREASELRIRALEIEENEKQAKSRLGAARILRTTGSTLVMMLAEGLQEIRRLVSDGDQQARIQARELLPHLTKIATAISLGMEQERKELLLQNLSPQELSSGDRTEQDNADRREGALLRLLRELAPPDKWEEVERVLGELDRTESD
jgi:hypothetical protein